MVCAVTKGKLWRFIGDPVQLSPTPIGDPVQLFRDPAELHAERALRDIKLKRTAVATRKDLFGCLGESPWLARRTKLKTYASFSPP